MALSRISPLHLLKPGSKSNMYDLLQDIIILEVSLLGPDALGMHLADLGANVIKVEEPPSGSYIRSVGGTKIDEVSTLHLRWNRGKKSVTLDLKRPEGRDLFLELAKRVHVVIAGLRAGAMERFGVGYESLCKVNPGLVYCSLNGSGLSGPYHKLAMHGVAFDAYAGLAPPSFRADGTPYIDQHFGAGLETSALYAALAVSAALVQAKTSGAGQHIEVSELDSAISWQASTIDSTMNKLPADFQGMENAVRYQYYRTKDDHFFIFQCSEEKFFANFCKAVGREDLLDRGPRKLVGDHARGDEDLRRELAKIMLTKTRSDWVDFFITNDCAGAPVYSTTEVTSDSHFQSRGLTFEQTLPNGREVKWLGTPIKLQGQKFSPKAAPTPGQHTDQILMSLLDLPRKSLDSLRSKGVIT